MRDSTCCKCEHCKNLESVDDYLRIEFALNRYCTEQPICDYCPIKKFVPICGRGWHIASNGNIKQQDAAMLIFIGAKMLKEDEPHYEK